MESHRYAGISPAAQCLRLLNHEKENKRHGMENLLNINIIQGCNIAYRMVNYTSSQRVTADTEHRGHL